MRDRAPIDLSDIFSSRASFKVLEVLAPLRHGLHLRAIERETGLQIRSIQNAVEKLLAAKVLLKSREGRFIVASRSPVCDEVRGLFQWRWRRETQRKAESLSNKARAIITLSHDVSTAIDRSRKSK